MNTEPAGPQGPTQTLRKDANPAEVAIAVPHAARPKGSARLFIVEGEIAAGKTELVRAVAERLRATGLSVCLALEPVDLWKEVGILGKFYSDPGRYGYAFQTFVYATRIQEIAMAVRDNPDADVYLLERSPATDKIFWFLQEGVVDPVEVKLYHTWCDAWDLMLPVALARAQVLYLKTSLESCMNRLARRHRPGEVGVPEKVKHDGSATGGVSLEYQLRLRRAHEAFLLGLHADEFPRLQGTSPFPRESIIEIEAGLADGNFRDQGPERDRIVTAIVQKMGLGLAAPQTAACETV